MVLIASSLDAQKDGDDEDLRIDLPSRIFHLEYVVDLCSAQAKEISLGFGKSLLRLNIEILRSCTATSGGNGTEMKRVAVKQAVLERRQAALNDQRRQASGDGSTVPMETVSQLRDELAEITDQLTQLSMQRAEVRLSCTLRQIASSRGS